MMRILVLILLAVGLSVYSVGADTSVAGSSTASSIPFFDHVLFVMMENQNINSTYNCGSQCDAFLTPFANSNGLALNYQRVEDGSLPNYFALLGGQINSNPFPGADCTAYNYPSGSGFPPYCPQTNLNLVDSLENAGLSWKAYVENYPGSGSGTYYSSGGCYLAYEKYQIGNEDATYYASDHNPFVYYSDIVDSSARCGNIVTANSQHSSPETDDVLLSDLSGPGAPNFMWLTPDECDQMHHSCYPYSSTDNTGALQQGSDYLSQLIPQVLNSYAFKNERSVLFVTFDENCAVANPPGCGNTMSLYSVWASNQSKVTKGAYKSDTFYNHYSFLSTIESNWNLSPLTSNDANAQPMLEFFKPPPPPPTTDFRVSASPTSAAVNTGASANSTVTIDPVNGFRGDVSLSYSISPAAGLSCSLSPKTVTLGSSATSHLECSGSPGVYDVAITGSSGSLTHAVRFVVSVQDFTLSDNPGLVTVSPGEFGSSNVTVAAIDGFSGLVGLASNSTSCTVAPGSLAGSGNATLSCMFSSVSAVHILVTGTNGRLSHSQLVTFDVQGHSVPIQDFQLSASPISVSLNAGDSATSNVTLIGLNGFDGAVSLSTNSSSCAIVPASLRGSGEAVLSCSFSSAILAYVVVTASSGPLSHSRRVTFDVVARSSTTANHMSTVEFVAIVVSGFLGFILVNVLLYRVTSGSASSSRKKAEP